MELNCFSISLLSYAQIMTPLSCASSSLALRLLWSPEMRYALRLYVIAASEVVGLAVAAHLAPVGYSSASLL